MYNGYVHIKGQKKGVDEIARKTDTHEEGSDAMFSGIIGHIPLKMIFNEAAGGEILYVESFPGYIGIK